ncbi:UNVERIFIED_CONTAM: malonyl-CoA O-methyltransferase [Acetivibrio alkalicellulosi]
MIDKEKLKRRFSRNAMQYDKFARVQKKMGDILINNINSTGQDYQNILEIGCGTGYVTRLLLSNFNNAKITGLDIAPGMIDYVKSTVTSKNVDFICSDIEEINITKKYDLIVSNATFQWFNNLEKTLVKIVNLLKPGGFFCFSTFGTNTFRELKNSFEKTQILLDIQQDDISPGQTFISANQLESICKKQSYNYKISEVYEYEFFNCCRNFLYSIKKIGANNSCAKRNNLPPDFIEKVIEIYDRDYKENDKVIATYHNLFVYITS